MSARFLGDFRNQPHCELPKEYFETRDCWVDCRETDTLWISKEANFGWDNVMVTQSHNVNPGMFGQLVGRKIIVERLAFVTSHCILYNCRLGEGAVVAVGSVVRSQQIPPWTMVAGNPAVPIKRFDALTGKWEKIHV